MTSQLPHVFFDAADTLFRLSQPVGVAYAALASDHQWIVDTTVLNRAFIDTWKAHSAIRPDYLACPSGEHAEYLWWQTLTARIFEQAAQHPSTQVGQPASKWFDQIFDHYANASAWHLFCDTIPALNRLQKAGIPIHVLSNFDHRLKHILRGFGIIDKFTTITTSSEARARKPDRASFDFARAAAGSPSHCTHIGDDPINDRAGALGAGFNAILVDRQSGVDLMTITDQLLAQTR